MSSSVPYQAVSNSNPTNNTSTPLVEVQIHESDPSEKYVQLVAVERFQPRSETPCTWSTWVAAVTTLACIGTTLVEYIFFATKIYHNTEQEDFTGFNAAKKTAVAAGLVFELFLLAWLDRNETKMKRCITTIIAPVSILTLGIYAATIGFQVTPYVHGAANAVWFLKAKPHQLCC